MEIRNCGGGTCGAGSCPSECKRDDNRDGKCGNGFSSASGCGNCGKAANGTPKICCKANKCGPKCSDSAPAAPVLQLPASEAVLASTATTLSWTGTTSWGTNCAGNNNVYKIYLSSCLAAPAAILDPIAQYAEVPGSTVSVGFTGANGMSYCWKVVASNGVQSAATAPRRFRINSTLSGTVYLDSGNTCSTATPLTLAGLRTRIRGTAYTGVVSAVNGTYSITAPSGIYGYLDLGGIPANYVCSSACTGCPTKTSVVVTSAGNNFFLTNKRDAWWQAQGASVYAGGLGGGVTIRSELPSASTRLIAPGTGGAVGALLRASGTTDLGLGTVSTPGYSTIARYRGKVMDYDYFASQMGVLTDQPNDWASVFITKPSYDPAKPFSYILPDDGSASPTAKITAPWVVPSGEKHVVFVNGNLEINSSVTVNSGGFLAFIVKGNIRVAANVTTLQGIYLADSDFTSQSVYVAGVTNDVQLTVSGSVIAWGSVTLQRNLGAPNVNTPAEKFVYRPDLIVNMPDKLKVFALLWQEVPPGTID